MASSYLYGLEYANHKFDGSNKDAFGKNIFTNAFPIALSRYLDHQGFGPIYITAEKQEAADDSGSQLTSARNEYPLAELIGCDPEDATWLFEASFDGYKPLATNNPNRSDIVVFDRSKDVQTRALEVKLVTVPNSSTAKKCREEQSCEIVTRPMSIEQMCFSIARSYGSEQRHEIGDIITEHLGNPMDFRWAVEQPLGSGCLLPGEEGKRDSGHGGL